MSAKKLEVIKKRLLQAVEAADRNIKTFSEKVIEQPRTTLMWASDTFEQAAKREVALSVLHAIEQGVNDAPHVVLAGISNFANREVRNKAQFPERSTNPLSNMFSQDMGTAWVNVLDMIGDDD